MDFIPLYFKEKLTIINSGGYVGVVTLWSRQKVVIERFRESGVDLDPATSPIAVFGNLYGNGIKYLLANLLNNPQIRVLVICGSNRSRTMEELHSFFANGTESYVSEGVERQRIVGTGRLLDNCLSRALFENPPEVVVLGDILKDEFSSAIKSFFDSISRRAEGITNAARNLQRMKVDLPEVKVSTFPSNLRAHTIVEDAPLEAWKELIYRLHRFGTIEDLGPNKGRRKELQNVKVIVETPVEESGDVLSTYGFSLDAFKSYQEKILNGQKREDDPYDYGNRIREHFGLDALYECIARLKENTQDRRSFISLWDTRFDMMAQQSTPCMVTIFFRVLQGRLTLSATFRVHNAIDAWLQNLYGLMAIQRTVCDAIGVPAGAITIISHSISLNISDYDKISGVIKEKGKKFRFRPDPCGQFRVSVEEGLIVVRQLLDGNVVNEYRSKKAERLQYELNRDSAISDIGHAIFIGRQMARAEMCIKRGEAFTEDP
ncbi:MAG: hypothetical protein HQK89_03900 [Nitrospirae bacterium]|nr:hypothetical protein [Nitrospirota bacterium]